MEGTTQYTPADDVLAVTMVGRGAAGTLGPGRGEGGVKAFVKIFRVIF